MVAGSVILATSAAYAEGKSKAGWGAGGLGPVKIISGVGSPGSTTVPGGSGEGTVPTTTVPSQDKWVTQPCPSCLAEGLVCLADGEIGSIPSGSPLPPGDSEPFITFLEGPTGVASAAYTCAGSPPPPPPPAAGQVWEDEPLPAAQIETDPQTDGLTQLPTWFWLANDATGQRVSLPTISINGYSVALSVHPVAYRWDFGDGSTVTSATNGTGTGAGQASATHTYTDKGTFTVGVAVQWIGSYTFSGHGISNTVALGPVWQTAGTVSFRVQEVRSLLTGG
jgi:PKD domain